MAIIPLPQPIDRLQLGYYLKANINHDDEAIEAYDEDQFPHFTLSLQSMWILNRYIPPEDIPRVRDVWGYGSQYEPSENDLEVEDEDDSDHIIDTDDDNTTGHGEEESFDYEELEREAEAFMIILAGDGNDEDVNIDFNFDFVREEEDIQVLGEAYPEARVDSPISLATIDHNANGLDD